MADSCDSDIAALHAFAEQLLQTCDNSDLYLNETTEQLDELVEALHRLKEDALTSVNYRIYKLSTRRDELDPLIRRCAGSLELLEDLLTQNATRSSTQAEDFAGMRLLHDVGQGLSADARDLRCFRDLVMKEARRKKRLINDLWNRLKSGRLDPHFLAGVVDWTALDQELQQLGPRQGDNSRVHFPDEQLSPDVSVEALPSKTPSPAPVMQTPPPVQKDKRYQATVEEVPDEGDPVVVSPIRDQTYVLESASGTEVDNKQDNDENSARTETPSSIDARPLLKRADTGVIEKGKYQTLQDIEAQIRRYREEQAIWEEREKFRLYRHRLNTSDEMDLFDERGELLHNLPSEFQHHADFYVMPSGSTFSRSHIQDRTAHLRRTRPRLENLGESPVETRDSPPASSRPPTPRPDSPSPRFFDGPLHDEPGAFFASPLSVHQPTPPHSPYARTPGPPESETPEVVTVIEKPLVVTLEEVLRGVTKEVRLSRRTYDKYTGGAGAETRTLRIQVKPGLKPGSRIKFRKAGDQGPKTAQDIHFVLKYDHHRQFSCEGSNLFHELDISADQAAAGWRRRIKAIDGSAVYVEGPPDTPAGWRKVFKGLGLPRSFDEAERGDLVVTVNILGARYDRSRTAI